jgi:hypothetical protein
MNMILGSRHEILSCIFYHFGTDILDGLPDEVGTSIFLMMDLKAEDGHTRGNICPNCIYGYVIQEYVFAGASYGGYRRSRSDNNGESR